MYSTEPKETGIETAPEPEGAREPRRSGRFTLVIAVLATVAITLGGVWLVRTYLFPRAFDPVELSAREQVVLDGKLDQLGVAGMPEAPPTTDEPTPLEPERYEEDDSQREVSFTEKELNGLLANNTNLASRLAIDLSDDLASAKLLIPMEEGFPVVGGKTIRVDAGLELSFRDNRPVVALRGISVMGVPIPDAWLGNMRNVDLVEEFGGDKGFWSSFAAGIESLQLDDGELRLRLAE
jgi:hypothetical protein